MHKESGEEGYSPTKTITNPADPSGNINASAVLAPLDSKPQSRGKGMLIAAGLVLTVAAIVLAIDAITSASTLHSIVLHAVLVPLIVLTIALLSIVFSGKKEMSTVLLILGIAQGILVPANIVLMEVFIYRLDLVTVFPLTMQILGATMMIYGALLLGRTEERVSSSVDYDGMMENKKPKGRVLILVGGITIAAVVFYSLPASLYHLVYLLVYSLETTIHSAFWQPGILGETIVALVNTMYGYSAFVLSLQAILGRSMLRPKKSFFVLCSFVSAVSFLLLLLSVSGLLNALTGLGYTGSIVYLLLLFVGSALVFAGSKLNERSPKRVFAPAAPKAQQPSGTQQAKTGQGAYTSGGQDASSFGLSILGFFIPIAGLILYLVWKEQFPLKAKSCGKGALIGVIVWTVLPFIIFGILMVILMIL